MKWANVEIDSSGTPMASDYGDVYFSRNDGIAETRYVFIEGNNLEERLRSYTENTPFVIGETGFGTGSNALILALYLKEKGLNNIPVHFVSTELHPIQKEELASILSEVPAFKDIMHKLIDSYDALIEGETMCLTDNLSLQVLVGDANETLMCLDDFVDAWFLDGFSPAKNPSMWQPDLFQAMAKASKPEATFATFTAARVVREGLEQAGFTYERVKGYGFKRHMLVGKNISM